MVEPVFRNEGHCPICERQVTFVAWSNNLRDTYLCNRCASIPRERALMLTLQTFYPNWRELRIHESSPAKRGVSLKMRNECQNYLETQYRPDVPEGTMHPVDGWRCENLERQTFEDESFDLVITQDVFEHIFDPRSASREIGRTLKKGGAAIATTPLVRASQPSIQCAALKNGEVVHYRKPDFHGNPVDEKGTLVTYWWGYDLALLIDSAASLKTLIFLNRDRNLGIDGPLIEVLVSFKMKAPEFEAGGPAAW
jgi:SAM-dependent methyltransferase